MCLGDTGMLAGGTGVTPMYQVANAILKNPADKTKITLLFANVSADDILIEEEHIYILHVSLCPHAGVPLLGLPECKS